MKERPVITFALFAYNQEQFIEEAVRGALSQTYSPLEIVLSDDCSSDRTYTIMQELAAAYSGPHTIILNHNEICLGLVGHVNKVAFQLSHGELIVVSAGDDISVPVRTENIWKAWEETDRRAFAISSSFRKINISGMPLDDQHTNHVPITTTNFMDSVRSFAGIAGCASAYHKDVFAKFGPLRICKIEDRNLALRGMMLGDCIAVNHELVFCRMIGMSSGLNSKKQWLTWYAKSHISVYQQLIEDVRSSVAGSLLPQVDIRNVVEYSLYRIKVINLEATVINGKWFRKLVAWLALFVERWSKDVDCRANIRNLMLQQSLYAVFLFPEYMQDYLFVMYDYLLEVFVKIRRNISRVRSLVLCDTKQLQ